MYGITKTRMLLTTGVFAAVAALFAAGASARIPADPGSDFAAQESLGIGRYAVLPSRDEGRPACRDEGERGVLRRGDLRGPRPRTTPRRTHQRGRDQVRNPGAIQECSDARAAKSIAPVLASSDATQGVSASALASRSDVVSRYLDNNRTSTSQKRLARPRSNKFPDGRRSAP